MFHSVLMTDLMTFADSYLADADVTSDVLEKNDQSPLKTGYVIGIVFIHLLIVIISLKTDCPPPLSLYYCGQFQYNTTQCNTKE